MPSYVAGCATSPRSEREPERESFTCTTRRLAMQRQQRPTKEEMSLANSLVTSYVDGTQDTNAGVQVAMAWHASLAEDRDRALVGLAYAVVAHRKDHTAKTRRNYECARGRVIKLSQFEQLTIIANTILLPRDCPLTHLIGSD
ncbi:hypothetical protein B0H13DRAFT_1904402 [Mycena leptocephala]|nr:hypothetical protein B0H13DRAFT_1904402 [Mycena leptocephala]